MSDNLVQRLRDLAEEWYEMCDDIHEPLYEAADRIEAQAAEIERLRSERDDAVETLDAWFDRRKLAHEAIDAAVLDATKGYLRVSRNGGMDSEKSDLVQCVVEDMARLNVFADMFARAALEYSGLEIREKGQ